jgi:hypothetical protein
MPEDVGPDNQQALQRGLRGFQLVAIAGTDDHLIGRQMSASRTSRTEVAARSTNPRKTELCCAINKVENATPKTIPRYFTKSPVSMRKAIQLIAV